MRTFEEVQEELRECINHAYRDECEDIKKFGGNTQHLDNAMHRLNELIEIHKAGALDMASSKEVETLKKKVVHEIKTFGCFNPKDVERGGVSVYLPCTMKELVLLLGLLEGTTGEEKE